MTRIEKSCCTSMKERSDLTAELVTAEQSGQQKCADKMGG
jgi:hypothetical protein